MKLNRPLTFREKIEACRQQNEVLPMKGHFKMILEDVRDGSQEIVEQDNVITEAVSTILNHNYCGLARYNQLFPMKSLYGGIFLHQNTQTEQASNWHLVNDTQNPLVAHAGDLANNSGSLLRGSPVSNEWIEGDTSIQMTWMWDNTQGCGHIASASIVPNTLGNMSIKPFDDEFSPLSSFGDSGELDVSATLDESEIIKYPFDISDDGKYSTSIYMDGTSFKEITVRHDYYAFGIMRGVDDFQVVTSRTATIRAGVSGRIVFDDASYYYIAQAYYDSQTSKYGLYIDKVNKTTFAVTQADIQYDTITLYTGTIYEDMKGNQRIFGFDGTYLYFPNNAGTGFVKLNISDASDKEAIDGTIDIGMGRCPSGSDAREFATPIALSEGLIFGSNYIINGHTAYPIKHARQIGISGTGNYGTASNLLLVKKGASVYGKSRYIRSSAYRSYHVNVLMQAWHGSVVNLPEAKDKGTSQTMRCVYSISEQTS